MNTLSDNLRTMISSDLDGTLVRRNTPILVTIDGHEKWMGMRDAEDRGMSFAGDPDYITEQRNWVNFRDMNMYGQQGQKYVLENIAEAIENGHICAGMEPFVDLLSVGGFAFVNTASGHEGQTLSAGVAMMGDRLIAPENKRSQIEAIRDNFKLSTEEYPDNTSVLNYYYYDLLYHIGINSATYLKNKRLDSGMNDINKTVAFSDQVDYVRWRLGQVIGLSSAYQGSIDAHFNEDSLTNITTMAQHCANIAKEQKNLSATFSLLGEANALSLAVPSNTGIQSVINQYGSFVQTTLQ